MDIDEIAIILSRAQPFNTLDPAVLEKLAGLVMVANFGRGDDIFQRGSPSQDCLFIVARGRAEILVGEEGEEAVAGHREVGQFFGETVILSGKDYPATVRAATELTCLILPRRVFEELLDTYPAFTRYFSGILAERMRELYAEVLTEESGEGYRPFLFQTRLAELMSTPVITCSPDTPVAAVACTMREHNIGAVVVEEEGKPLGLVTERDLVQQVMGPSLAPADVLAGQIMHSYLPVLESTQTLADALVLVAHHPTKYVGITSDARLVGLVSQTDLVRARAPGLLVALGEIEEETTLSGLSRIGRICDRVLQSLVQEELPVRQLLEIMTTLYDRLTRRVIELVISELGPPPADFAWMNLGSSGRREQALRADQDNAIIYADPPPWRAEEVAGYFAELGQRVVTGLQSCGFARCLGGVMAANADWRHSLAGWERLLRHWRSDSRPQNVMFLSTFLDFRYIYGSEELVHRLRHLTLRLFRQVNMALFLAENALANPVALNLWGQWRTERGGEHRGELNLKTGVSVQLVDCIRLYCLQEGITETSTWQRLQALGEAGIFSAGDIEAWRAAFTTLTGLRLRINLQKLAAGIAPDNYVNPARLSKREQQSLREAMLAVARLQRLTEASIMGRY